MSNILQLEVAQCVYFKAQFWQKFAACNNVPAWCCGKHFWTTTEGLQIAMGLGFEPGQGVAIEFLGKKLYAVCLTLFLLQKCRLLWIIICFNQFAQNLEEILIEWQTAWKLTRRWVTWRLVWFPAVCKGLKIVNSRRRVMMYSLTFTVPYSKRKCKD